MTPNRSLSLSAQLQMSMGTDLLHHFNDDFPYGLLAAYQEKSNHTVKRDRIFNEENTILTMLLTAIHEDKSLKQSVNIFKEVFELKGKQMQEKEYKMLQFDQAKEAQRIATGGSRNVGRPNLYHSQLAKSKTMEVSENTAAYTKARQRIDRSLISSIFNYSVDFGELNGKTWHGLPVYITDGTYFQMQDTPVLRKKYYVKEGDNAYPQGLLQTIIRQISGQIYDFQIGTRHQSELELVKPLIENLPARGLLLADDLYSTYAIFSLMQKKGCDLIVPGKRDRNYKVIEQLSDGDEIVELKKTAKPDWLSIEEWNEIPKSIRMRRISYTSIEDEKEEHVLYTTLLDKKINKIEIILKYRSRWDIEITIREIKTLMGINIARSKTEDMVIKEITIALTAYNMVRKIIAKSVEKTDFPPQENFFYKCIEVDKKLLVDKKGRIYHHWSTGRYGQSNSTN